MSLAGRVPGPRGIRRAVEPPRRGVVMAKRVVLAYSGGLDTSVAVRWMIEEWGSRWSACWSTSVRTSESSESFEDISEPRPGGRRDRVRGGRRPRRDGRGVLRQGHRWPTPLRGQVPAGLGAVAAGDRAPPGGPGPQVRRPRRGPRLHRQGQRPGPLRGRDARAGPRPRGPRPGAQLGHDPRRLGRLRREVGDPAQGHQGEDLLDRREPLGPGHRVRRDRGPVGRPPEEPSTP
jgi:hypothetical protein